MYIERINKNNNNKNNSISWYMSHEFATSCYFNQFHPNKEKKMSGILACHLLSFMSSIHRLTTLSDTRDPLNSPKIMRPNKKPENQRLISSYCFFHLDATFWLSHMLHRISKKSIPKSNPFWKHIHIESKTREPQIKTVDKMNCARVCLCDRVEE